MTTERGELCYFLIKSRRRKRKKKRRAGYRAVWFGGHTVSGCHPAHTKQCRSSSSGVCVYVCLARQEGQGKGFGLLVPCLLIKTKKKHGFAAPGWLRVWMQAAKIRDIRAAASLGWPLCLLFFAMVLLFHAVERVIMMTCVETKKNTLFCACEFVRSSGRRVFRRKGGCVCLAGKHSLLAKAGR